ncbi:MAG: RluA family pseudouridine synthase [Candidatus Acidiferrales bacterium]
MPKRNPDTIEFLSFIVTDEDSGVRLDRYLATHAADLSRTRLQELIAGGRVHVNGITTKPSHRVETGEEIKVEIPPPEPLAVGAEPIPLEVLYEDDDLAVINKPAGIVVHPGAGETGGTLVSALLYRFGKLSTIGGPARPGIVHRLDKGTSGALIVARTDDAHRRLVEEFQDRSIEKTYVALLHGKLREALGRIELPVARDLRRRTRMTTRRREGRPARTDWRALLVLGGFTWIEAGLHTGRTHQLRVHFSALGSPVVGDTLYGAPREELVHARKLPELGRNFLHAARIRFLHPRTEEPIDVRAPLPPELAAYLKQLGSALGADPGTIDAALSTYL